MQSDRTPPHLPSEAPSLKPAIISAPFGNYVQPAGATATLGTFTAAARPGRIWRIAKTVRYYRRLGAWVNRIGLRNPGIDWLVRRADAGRIDVTDKIVSIHGFTDGDWSVLLDRVAQLRPMAVELNMSCPNVGEIAWPEDLFIRASGVGLAVIVKLPPIRFETMADRAVEAGLHTFHCCNTLPVPGGGLSGTPLKPISLRCIAEMRRAYGDAVKIIGGGGIRIPSDIEDYARAGANHMALGTIAMNPKLLFTDRPLRPLIDHAARVLGSGLPINSGNGGAVV